MLPLLPVYISYFAGGGERKRNVSVMALSFVLGFTFVFCSMGLFAGVISSFLMRYQTVLNIICGALVIVFGLSYLEVISLPFFRGAGAGKSVNSVFSAFLFGVVYSVSLTPCVGAFLGSALMLASSSGTALKGLLLLLSYSMGLGIPFIISAVLIKQLNSAFSMIKKHYRVINAVCGVFLIFVGLMMASGMLNKLMAVFS